MSNWHKRGASGLGRILNMIAGTLIILLSLGIMYGYYALLPPHKAVLLQYTSTAQDGFMLADLLRYHVDNEVTIGDLISNGDITRAGSAVKAYLEGLLDKRGYRLRISDTRGAIVISERKSEILATHRDPWADSVVSVGILPQKNGPPMIVALEVLQS